MPLDADWLPSESQPRRSSNKAREWVAKLVGFGQLRAEASREEEDCNKAKVEESSCANTLEKYEVYIMLTGPLFGYCNPAGLLRYAVRKRGRGKAEILRDLVN